MRYAEAKESGRTIVPAPEAGILQYRGRPADRTPAAIRPATPKTTESHTQCPHRTGKQAKQSVIVVARLPLALQQRALAYARPICNLPVFRSLKRYGLRYFAGDCYQAQSLRRLCRANWPELAEAFTASQPNAGSESIKQ